MLDCLCCNVSMTTAYSIVLTVSTNSTCMSDQARKATASHQLA